MGADRYDCRLQWINDKSGTHRSVSGLLSETAGRVLTLDNLASEFFSANVPERSEIVKKAQETVTTLDKKSRATADYYIKAMERITAKGEEWLAKEQARYVPFL